MKKSIKTLLISAFTAAVLMPTLTSCGFTYCQHKLETIKGTPATCKENGIKSYYKCEFCDQLFGYDRYGIYEIEEPEVDTNSTHNLVYLPKTRGLSNRLNRVGFVSHCTICEEDFEIDDEDITRFAPSTNFRSYTGGTAQNTSVSAKHVLEESTVGTEFTFKAGTQKDNKITIWRDSDSPISGTSGTYETSIPYISENVTDTMLLFRNESDTDIQIKYAAEDVGARSWAIDASGSDIITIKAHSITTAYLPIKFVGSQPGCCHEIYTVNDVTSETKVTIWGGFLLGTYKSLGANSGKFAYKVGERFTATGLELVANYFGLLKTSKPVDVNECDIPLRGKVLTSADKILKVTYRGINTYFALSVYDPNDFREFKLAKDVPSSYKVGDIIDYSLINFEAIYGEERTYTALDLTIDDVEHEKILEPLTLEDNGRVLTFTYEGRSVNLTLNVTGGATNE